MDTKRKHAILPVKTILTDYSLKHPEILLDQIWSFSNKKNVYSVMIL